MKSNTPKGSAGQEGLSQDVKLYFGKCRGRGSHREVSGSGPRHVSMALLALLQLFRVAVTKLPLRAAAGLGQAAVGGGSGPVIQ